ncbi:MAG: hypothetical protein Q8N31_24295 [Reyranella sp.]|nr:hypothetical protein [Reyranella sp.]MDP3163147.1 hypothetical protein [Reyranella sp.]
MTDANNKPDSDRKIWNSLEICKLAATVITPIAVVALGYLIWSGQRSVVQHWEREQIEQRRLADADAKERESVRGFRLSIYKEAAPLLNEIVSYHFYVGSWKERSPADVIESKRQLDTLMYSNIALFTPTFFDLYRTFMRQSFRSAGNYHGESRIRTQDGCRPSLFMEADRWKGYFTQEDRRKDLCLAYVALLGALSEELLLQSLKMPIQTEAQQFSTCPPLYERATC